MGRRTMLLVVLVTCTLLALVLVGTASSTRQSIAPDGDVEDAVVGGSEGADGSGDSDAALPDEGTGASNEALPVDEDAVASVVDALSAQGWSAPVREAGELGQVATRLLGSYRDAGDCVLAWSGYLDLVGSVWGCVVQGDGWADVCVVHACEGDACEVRVLRIDAEELAETLADDAGTDADGGDGL